MKFPKKILEFGKPKRTKHSRYCFPYTQVFFLGDFVLLKIQDLNRDFYKKDWYEFNGYLKFAYHGRKYLYLIVEKFKELHTVLEQSTINYINLNLGFYDEHDYYMKDCLDSGFSAIIKVGEFLNKFPEYRNKQYDFSENLMIDNSGNFIFCDPLV